MKFKTEYVGIKDIVASKLCSRNTLLDLIATKNFPKGVKVGGKKNSPLKFYVPDIIAWYRAQQGVQDD